MQTGTPMTIKTFSQRFVPEDTSEKPSIPERNLLAEVLARACRDLLNPTQLTGRNEISESQSMKEIREASSWFMSKSEEPFSFVWICKNLDLSSKEVRQIIFEFKKNKINFKMEFGRIIK